MTNTGIHKKCSICKKDLPIAQFHFQNQQKGQRISACKVCAGKRTKWYLYVHREKHNQRRKEKYQANKEFYKQQAKEYRKKFPDRTRNTNLKQKYGITLLEYEKILKEQKNKCKICRRNQKDYKKTFAVDHDHKTNKIRGILCDPCNYGLGFYEKHKDKYKKYLTMKL